MTVSAVKTTTRKDLQDLVRVEFHKEDGTFDGVEPDAYLQRLTRPQIELLTGRMMRPNRLTAFIVFGDGAIDRALGGGSLVPTAEKFEDSLRPNASLALFYKGDDGKVELVFYTRSLEVGYTSSQEPAPTARQECRKLDTETDPGRRETIRKSIFEAMKKLPSVRNGFLPVDKSPSPDRDRYHFALMSWIGAHRDECVPYIRLWKKDRKEPSWFSPEEGKTKNAIHGALNTKGCWMLLRNYLWQWPREDTDQTYTRLMQALLLAYRSGGATTAVQDAVKAALGATVAPSPEEWSIRPKNIAYFAFLRMFAGMRYNNYDEPLSFPDRPGQVVGDSTNSRTRFVTTLPDPEDHRWRGHTLQFTTGNLAYSVATVSDYSKTTRAITVRSPLREVPNRDSRFMLHRMATVVHSARNSRTEFKTDLLEETDNFWGRGESLRFVSGNVGQTLVTIRDYDGAARVITLEPPGLGATPDPGAKFRISNNWRPIGTPTWGPNAFGQSFGFGQFWADVFFFRRGDRFTRDPGDTDVFRSGG